MSEQQRYCYCSNHSCPHLMSGTQGPDSSAGMHVLPLTPGQTVPDCPYCGNTMTAQCPNCGHALISRPMRFCPACGSQLLGVYVQPVSCKICGRPIYGSDNTHMGVPLCSERCIGIFIMQSVRICDQCGRRFNVADAPVPEDGDPNAEHDFCSEDCREAFCHPAPQGPEEPLTPADAEGKELWKD
ncbi:MAG: zinc ribbon domain-containing protein [Desulfovibrio sp.]|jgi:endogenous inhibitor of DNA gyrase (YacG/DUF329 family)|nr:zinc ribbon domain-containing protein [Desulfovibrio sp.]